MRTQLLTRPGLFLAAAAGLVLLVGAQTFAAVTAQHRLTERVLTDHARTAAWTLEQGLAASFGQMMECGFHGSLHSVSGEQRMSSVPSAAQVRERWGAEAGCRTAAEIPRWVVRLMPDGSADVAGIDAPPPDVVRGVVIEEHRGRRPVGRNHYLGSAPGTSLPLFGYLRARVGGGHAYWVVPLDAGMLASVLEHSCGTRALLPPTVWPEDSPPELLPVLLEPGGGMFGEGIEDAVAKATWNLSPELFGGLRATVHITPAAAAILAPESVARGKLPLLAIMLLVSLGLVSVAWRQLHREQELARLRSDFVSSVSHELRTPLALQRIFLDTITLGRAAEPDRMAWAVENVDRESRRLQHLVSNVLQFARGERNQLDLECTPTDLREAVEGVVSVFAPLAERSGSRVVVEGDGGARVDLDAAAFHQALANVLENSCRYGPEGQTVRVYVGREHDRGVVVVDDEGRGVEASERQRVFNPFHRGRAAIGTAVTGSGIGLSVVRQVLRAHGGEAVMESAPGGGARVRMTLPLASSNGAGGA